MSAFGDPIAENTPEDKKHADWLEIIATVLLGIAAVLIAWSTYQSQLWGGVQAERSTSSALEIVDAADDLGRADAERSLDQLLFGDYILRPDPDEAELLLSQMSDPGRVASERWFRTDEARPFDGDVYTYGIYGDGLARRDAAFVLFDRAAEANQNGDDYVLAATIIALVLFLSGISLVLKGHRTRVILVASSGVVLAGVIVYVIGLPLASRAPSEEEIRLEATDVASANFAALAEQAELDEAELDQAALEESDGATLDDAPAVDEESAQEEGTAPDAADAFPTEGGTAFAVYVEVIEASASSGDLDADFAAALDFFDEAGVTAAVGSLDCDEGSVEGLGLEAGDYFGATAYFESMEDADAFAATYDFPPESIVEVRTFCLEEP